MTPCDAGTLGATLEAVYWRHKRHGKKGRHYVSGGDMMGVMRSMSQKIDRRRHERHATLPTKEEAITADAQRHLFRTMMAPSLPRSPLLSWRVSSFHTFILSCHTLFLSFHIISQKPPDATAYFTWNWPPQDPLCLSLLPNLSNLFRMTMVSTLPRFPSLSWRMSLFNTFILSFHKLRCDSKFT